MFKNKYKRTEAKNRYFLGQIKSMKNAFKHCRAKWNSILVTDSPDRRRLPTVDWELKSAVSLPPHGALHKARVMLQCAPAAGSQSTAARGPLPRTTRITETPRESEQASAGGSLVTTPHILVCFSSFNYPHTHCPKANRSFVKTMNFKIVYCDAIKILGVKNYPSM